MNILDQLQEKVTRAVSKIERLEARVKELETEKAQNDAKMQELNELLEMVDEDDPDGEQQAEAPQENTGEQQDAQPAEADQLYGHEQQPAGY